MAISDFGNELLVTNQSGVTYDLNKDYSKAIAAAKAAGQDTALLEAQRQAKMNSAAYGGAYKTGAESSSLGSIYNENATISNRTSNASPIIVNSTIQEMADPLSNTAGLLSLHKVFSYVCMYVHSHLQHFVKRINKHRCSGIAILMIYQRASLHLNLMSSGPRALSYVSGYFSHLPR